ncbi:MAG: [FeFe] hydrogenase H-cluster maturation GTPase HydF [Brevinema sp.]
MTTGRGERFHISIFGKTNSGKSTLFNALLGQSVSVVSSVSGTTTDAVHKNFELLDAGPVVFIDTAGFGDGTVLAEAREKAARNIIPKTDYALVTIDALNPDYESFKDTARELKRFKIPMLMVLTKCDQLSQIQKEDLQAKYPDAFLLSSFLQEDMEKLLTHLTEQVKLSQTERKLISDLLPYGSRIVLVVPIDSEAPKGRIINPQVQVIREALDSGFEVIVVRDTELEQTLKRLNYEVDLVVTDSQAFDTVSKIVPTHIYLTGFSILFIRYKGDLKNFIRGLDTLKSIKPEDKIAIAESCSHNISCEDIGRFKIPTLLNKLLGFEPKIDFYTGSDFPEHPEDYKILIHCGACMTNRQTVLSRIAISNDAAVALINYGVILAYGANILQRSLQIFYDKEII